MKPITNQELLQILWKFGSINMDSLVLRLTGDFTMLFENLRSLKQKGFVEVEGDDEAVNNFVKQAIEMEKEGLSINELQTKLLKVIDEQPMLAETSVHLSKKGFLDAKIP